MGERMLPSQIETVLKDQESFETHLEQQLAALADLYRAAHIDEATIAGQISLARVAALQGRDLYIEPVTSAQTLGITGSRNEVRKMAVEKVAGFFDITERAPEIQAHILAAAPVPARVTTLESLPQPAFSDIRLVEIFTEGEDGEAI